MDKKIPCVQCYDGVVHPFFGRTVQLSGSLDSTSLAAAGIVGGVLPNVSKGGDENAPQSEQLVKKLYESLTPEQKKHVCFDWDHKDDRGLLRTHVSNNWSITDRQRLNVGLFQFCLISFLKSFNSFDLIFDLMQKPAA